MANTPQAELVIRDVDMSGLRRRKELAEWLKEQAYQLVHNQKLFDSVYHARFMKQRVR